MSREVEERGKEFQNDVNSPLHEAAKLHDFDIDALAVEMPHSKRFDNMTRGEIKLERYLAKEKRL